MPRLQEVLGGDLSFPVGEFYLPTVWVRMAGGAGENRNLKGGEMTEEKGLMPAGPKAVIKVAVEQARELKKIVQASKLAIRIRQSDHLKFEAWQTLGAFSGITSGVEWTKPLYDKEGNLIGFEARAVAWKNGEQISAAEAQCTKEEGNWKDRELWQIRSMAQTRACAKALRNVLSWIVVLAGYSPTPAEEMNHELPLFKKEGK